MTPVTPTATALADAPASVPSDLAAVLGADEPVLASVSLDLDDALRFTFGQLVLTPRRLIAQHGGGAWQSWPLADGTRLHLHDHAGVGCLALDAPDARLATWRYTLAQHADAARLADAFAREQAMRAAGGVRAPQPDADDTQRDFGGDVEPAEADSGWALMRLGRFARPYRSQLIIGFILTVLSTAATLVPPYLTMPLMDEVLIPFQNGAPIDTTKATWYLSGLLVSALLAWLLGWGRTYLLAWVSERIGADLRTTTYEQIGRAHV